MEPGNPGWSTSSKGCAKIGWQATSEKWQCSLRRAQRNLSSASSSGPALECSMSLVAPATLAIPAARAGAQVTGVDIATNLLQQARERAAAENLSVTFDEGDAEQLPYADAHFDVVMSMFGAMFAPRPEVTAQELLRVCRPGGLVAMANWTPEGFVGRSFVVTARHVPPPPGIPPPLLWGNENTVRERFAKGTRK